MQNHHNAVDRTFYDAITCGFLSTTGTLHETINT